MNFFDQIHERFWSPQCIVVNDERLVSSMQKGHYKTRSSPRTQAATYIIQASFMEEFEDIKRIRVHHSVGSVANPIKLLAKKKKNLIKLRIQRQGEAGICYIFHRKVPLRKLLADYCKMENLAYKVMRFLHDGSRVPADKCAADLEMEDGDIIDVFSDQIGG